MPGPKVFLSFVLLLAACQTTAPAGKPAAVGATVVATYECRVPDGQFGDGVTLRLYDDAKATLTFKGVVIAGKRDPVYTYGYHERGSDLDLVPVSHDAREGGPLRYSLSADTLTFGNEGFSLRCLGS